jgi:hypothetical protein
MKKGDIVTLVMNDGTTHSIGSPLNHGPEGRFIVSKICGGMINEYPDHIEREWYSIYAKRREIINNMNTLGKEVFVSEWNPSFVLGVIYWNED